MVNACYLCKRTKETCNHVLLWCLVVYRFWTMVYELLGINWVIASSAWDESFVWTRKRWTEERLKTYMLLIILTWLKRGGSKSLDFCYLVISKLNGGFRESYWYFVRFVNTLYTVWLSLVAHINTLFTLYISKKEINCNRACWAIIWEGVVELSIHVFEYSCSQVMSWFILNDQFAITYAPNVYWFLALKWTRSVGEWVFYWEGAS